MVSRKRIVGVNVKVQLTVFGVNTVSTVTTNGHNVKVQLTVFGVNTVSKVTTKGHTTSALSQKGKLTSHVWGTKGKQVHT